MGWLLVLVECATVCVKSLVILLPTYASKRLDLFIAIILHYNFLSLVSSSISISNIWLQIIIDWVVLPHSDIPRFWLIYLTTYPKIWLYLWTFPKENKNVLNIIRELVIGKGDLKERDAARFVREQESQLKQLLR